MIIGPKQYAGADDLTAGADAEVLVVNTQPVTVAGQPLPLTADTMILNQGIMLVSDGVMVRVGAYLQGNRDASVGQAIRGVVYTADRKLMACGEEIIIAPDAPAAWRMLPFTAMLGTRLPAGEYQAGVHAGPAGTYSGSVGAAEYFTVADGHKATYSDVPYAAGPPETLPVGVVSDLDAAFFLEVVAPITVPDGMTDDYIAALPFDVAQQVFKASAPIKSSQVSATAGWYGTSFDPTAGANAIVRSDSPLSDMVGERILVTRRDEPDRCVAVYVHNELAFPDEIASQDLVLTARAFLSIADWTLDDLDVRVAILA